MKKLVIIMMLSLVACGRESSPEGRSKIRDEKIQREIDDLKDQNNEILDSVDMINKKIKELRFDRKFE